MFKSRAYYLASIFLITLGCLILLGFLSSLSSNAKVSTVNPLQIKQISANEDQTCAVTVGGNVYCWGRNTSSGRLGIGDGLDKSLPARVAQGAIPLGENFKCISTGVSNGGAISSEDKAYCWGSGVSGMLGNGSLSNELKPVAVSQGAMPNGATIKQIATGDNNSCVIASDDKAYCWDNSVNGGLGNGVTSGTTGTFTNAVSSITLLSGSASSQFNCTWRLRSINLSQTIPANQAAGTYTIDMTATVVAG